MFAVSSTEQGSRKDRRDLLCELKRSIEQSIHTATRSLQYVDAALEELDVSKRPISVVVKNRPDTVIASVRTQVKNYTDILRFEQELINDLPARSIGDLRGVLW